MHEGGEKRASLGVCALEQSTSGALWWGPRIVPVTMYSRKQGWACFRTISSDENSLVKGWLPFIMCISYSTSRPLFAGHNELTPSLTQQFVREM